MSDPTPYTTMSETASFKEVVVADELKEPSILDKVKALSDRTKALLAAVLVVLVLLILYVLFSDDAEGLRSKASEGYATLGSMGPWWNWK